MINGKYIPVIALMASVKSRQSANDGFDLWTVWVHCRKKLNLSMSGVFALYVAEHADILRIRSVNAAGEHT